MNAQSSPERLFLRVFGYREDGEWVALALEMDLRGYGDSFEAAMEDLHDHVEAQISFALYKGQPEMIWKDAEPVWFDRFETTRREALAAGVSGGKIHSEDAAAATLPIPPAHVIESLKSGFSRASA